MSLSFRYSFFSIDFASMGISEKGRYSGYLQDLLTLAEIRVWNDFFGLLPTSHEYIGAKAKAAFRCFLTTIGGLFVPETSIAFAKILTNVELEAIHRKSTKLDTNHLTKRTVGLARQVVPTDSDKNHLHEFNLAEMFLSKPAFRSVRHVIDLGGPRGCCQIVVG